MERHWPNEFGQKSRLDLTIDMQTEIRELAEQNDLHLPPEQIVAMAEAIISQHVSEKRALDG